MKPKYQTRTIMMSNGERRAMLCDRATGIPLFKPTLYVASQVYLTGKECNSQRSMLTAIHSTYAWAEGEGIDLEKSFARGNFLSQQQVESLVASLTFGHKYCVERQSNFLFDFENPAKVDRPARGYRRHRPGRRAKPAQTNGDATTTIRLYQTEKYLYWLANESITRMSAKDPAFQAMQTARDDMIKAIHGRSPGKGRSELRRGLKPEERERFREVITPQHPANPFSFKFSKLRNQAICTLMLNLGTRRGETLLIKKEDIAWNLGSGLPTMKLQEHPNDRTDTRRVRPEFKTLERELPLAKNLERLLKAYLKERDMKPGAKSHGYLFVSHTGAPLSLSTLDNIYDEFSTVEGLPDDLTSHIPRYTWNDMFSEHADLKIEKGEWKAEDEKLARRYHQGWTEDSKMPDRYARRHNEEKAKKLSLEMQEENMADFVVVDLSGLPKKQSK